MAIQGRIIAVLYTRQPGLGIAVSETQRWQSITGNEGVRRIRDHMRSLTQFQVSFRDGGTIFPGESVNEVKLETNCFIVTVPPVNSTSSPAEFLTVTPTARSTVSPLASTTYRLL